MPHSCLLRWLTRFGLFLALLLGGCAWFDGDDESVGTDPGEVEEQQAAAADAFDEELDTGANEVLPSDEEELDAPPPDDIPPEPEEEEPVPTDDAANASDEGQADSAQDGDPAASSNENVHGTNESSPPAGEPAEILVELSPEERAKLEQKAREDLESARQHSANVRTRPELSQEQLERLETLDQYIASALESLEKHDVRAASSLALKARLLGEELDPN